jgi:selenide,water dikinase
VQTLDFFPPIVDDPRWFGRIAAANSLSDVYAMGGKALTAMNIVGWPKELGLDVLGEVLAGGLEKIREAGAVLCGGHSVVDHEIKYGLSVTGIVHPQRFWANGGARAGDVLVLSKPLGMGPVSTAIKREKVSAAVAMAAMQQMATLNKGACDAVRDLEVHGATDVTGFGLMGHGCEMAEGAGLCLQLRAADLPVLPGATDLVRSGVLSGGCTRGKAFYGPRVKVEPNIEQALVDLVFDAETSGGLMLAVPASIADKVVRRLKDAGAPCHACIGQFAPRAAGGPSVTLA